MHNNQTRKKYIGMGSSMTQLFQGDDNVSLGKILESVTDYSVADPLPIPTPWEIDPIWRERAQIMLDRLRDVAAPPTFVDPTHPDPPIVIVLHQSYPTLCECMTLLFMFAVAVSFLHACTRARTQTSAPVVISAEPVEVIAPKSTKEEP